MQAVTDAFAAPVRRPGDFQRSKTGTPYVSDPDGTLTKPKTKSDPGHIKRLAYGRPSGFGKLIEDMYSIHKWSERQLCLGFAIAPELVEAAKVLMVDDHDTEEWRSNADGVVVEAKRAAKAGIAADRGTHAHELTEDDDEGRDIVSRIEAGEELGMPPDVQHALVEAWRTMLERDGLEILAVESAVVHDGYRMAGTLDRVARLTKPLKFALHGGEVVELPAGLVPILDIKSGKRRRRDNGTALYWQGYAVQVAVYAGGVPYDTDAEERGVWPWEIDQKWALIAHLDVLGALDGKPTCDLILVDLEAGRRAADLCVAAKAWATEATVFSVAQLDVEGEISGPVDAASPAPSTPLTLVDAKAALAKNPDQGDDLSGADFGEQWAALQQHYEELDDAAKSWLAELISAAMRRNLTFHARQQRTTRVFELYRALISLAASGGDSDELLRALLALVIGDVAMFPGVEAGHVVGSLGVAEAATLATLVDQFHAGQMISVVDDDGTLRLIAA